MYSNLKILLNIRNLSCVSLENNRSAFFFGIISLYHNKNVLFFSLGFPDGPVVKNLPAKAREAGSIPGL